MSRGNQVAQSVLDALIDYREEHGFSPSTIELGAMVGLSRQTVWKALYRLEEAGAIRSTPGCTRSWVPTRTVAYPEAA